MPTMLLRALSDFRTLRRPCITYEPEVVDRKWFKKTEYKYFLGELDEQGGPLQTQFLEDQR